MTSKRAPSPVDTIEFVDAHRPKLLSGDYALTVALTLTVQAPEPTPATTTTLTAERSADFIVAGERYALAREDIHACYPPPGSAGLYKGNLPHVTLARSTLPWERSPRSGADAQSDPSWLAVLLFKGAEAPEIKRCPASALTTAETDRKVGLWPAQAAETCQDPKESVSYITVPRSAGRDPLPFYEELPYMAHARLVGAGGGAATEVAVVVGNRMIDTAGRYTAHLVSLEARYPLEPVASSPKDDHALRLVSLHHWEFESQGDGGFLPRMEALDGVDGTGDAGLRLPQPASRPAGVTQRAQDLLDAGSVPLVHRLRQGGQVVSFCRGPLAPAVARDGWLAQVPLPARSSDELLVMDAELGLFDATYALAWELGRLSALADRGFSVGLARWKRARARSAARLRLELDAAFLPHAAAAPDLADLPKAQSSFLARLARLDGVPGAYLVPDARMLPKESLRFFDVDPMWVRCLIDGALAVGRVTAGDASRDADHVDHLARPAAMSGLLLRSAVVAQYPKLAVAGYAMPTYAATEWNTTAVLDSGKFPRLPAPTLRRLAPDVLLALFDAERPLDLAEFHIPPEVLHFGVTAEEKDGQRTNTRTLRWRDGNEAATLEIVKGHMRDDRSGQSTVLRFDKIAEAMLTALRKQARLGKVTPWAEMHGGLFALQMLESAPCFRVRRGEVRRG